jgi:hypothetical protein
VYCLPACVLQGSRLLGPKGGQHGTWGIILRYLPHLPTSVLLAKLSTFDPFGLLLATTSFLVRSANLAPPHGSPVSPIVPTSIWYVFLLTHM